MTVIDSSAIVDFLLGVGVAAQVEAMFEREGELAAPDLLVFEVLSVLRREVGRGGLAPARAAGASADLGDLPLALFGALPLRARAWSLRENLTVADALFISLAEHLAEPLATKDLPLVRAAAGHAQTEVRHLVAPA